MLTTQLLSTGTTLVLLSDNSVDAFYSKMQGAKLDSQAAGYIFPSNVTLFSISSAIAVGDCQITMYP